VSTFAKKYVPTATDLNSEKAANSNGSFQESRPRCPEQKLNKLKSTKKRKTEKKEL
jgi:hypothetical protein